MTEVEEHSSRRVTSAVALVPVFAGLMTAMLLSSLDQTIIVTALPRIVGELGSVSQISWVVTAYLLASTVSLPLWGKLSDLYGRGRLYQLAIGAFLAGSAFSGAAWSVESLVGGRALQGVGAGGILALSHAIIGDLVSPRERGRYIAYLGSIAAISGLAGPLVGGTLVDQLSWRWVFYINLPLGAVALGLVRRFLHLPPDDREVTIDYRGAAVLAAGVTSLLLITTWGGQSHPWGSPTMIVLVLGCLACAALFVHVEHKSPEPIIPLELFRDRVFSTTALLGLAVGGTMFGALLLLPIYFQSVRGTSATVSGFLLMPMLAGFLLTSIVSGRAIARWGRYRIFPLLGMGLMAVALGLFSIVGPTTSWWWITTSMVVLGLAMGLVMHVLTIVVQNVVPQTHLGVATAVTRFVRNIGAAVGTAVAGAVVAARFASSAGGAGSGLPDLDSLAAAGTHLGALQAALADAIGFAFAVLVPVAIVGLVLAWLLEERPLRSESWVEAGAARQGSSGGGERTGVPPLDV